MHIVLSLMLVLLAAMPCHAQEPYPNRPVKVVVPWGPGGTVDFTGRAIADQLSRQTGTPFVVENRPGASGAVGAAVVARAAPDGYTLMLVDSTFTIIPSTIKSLQVDVVKDFTPITEMLSAPMVLVVSPGVKANNLQEFIALAKANPGKLNYASGGTGSSTHIAPELFKLAAKVDIAHIPYKGAGDAMTAILGDQVQMAITTMPSALAMIKSGKLRALAITTQGKRSAVLPDVPSMGEAGLQGVNVVTWVGLAGPAGLPPEVVKTLQTNIAQALQNPELRARFAAQGAEAVASTPQELSKLIQSEVVRWGEVAKAAGVQPE